MCGARRPVLPSGDSKRQHTPEIPLAPTPFSADWGFTAQARRDSSRPVKVLDKYFTAQRQRCAELPDPRRGRNTRYSIADIGMATFPVFFTQSPSFLAHQRMPERTCGRLNCLTLSGMDGIPTDNHIRNILKPAPPEHFDDVLINMVRDLEARGACTATVSTSTDPPALVAPGVDFRLQ